MCCISLSNICSGSQAFKVDIRKLSSRWLWLFIFSSACRRIFLCSMYYLKPDSFLVKIYDRIKARVKINIIEEKKRIFGRGKKRYVTKELNIRELVAMTPEEKEAKGVVIQEISMSKLALAAF